MLNIQGRYKLFLALILCLHIPVDSFSQVCSGTWALQRPATIQCVTGQWIGWENVGSPSDCPATPTYSGVQINTFNFANAVNSFSIDFKGFDTNPGCAKLEIKINGVFYHLNDSNISDFPIGTSCTTGSFSYIFVTPEGYITASSSGGSGLSGHGRLTINYANTSSVTISTNDGSGTVFSNPFNCNSVVPLILENFTARSHQNCTAILNWKTGIEVNVLNIGIQRSENGIAFHDIAYVNPKGSNSDYTFISQHNSDGYFRLKITDLDGSYAFSETIFLRSSCKSNTYILFPNPATNQIQIEGLKSSDRIIITDMLGKIVRVYDKPLIQKLDVSSIPMGVYILNVFEGEERKAILKMVKK